MFWRRNCRTVEPTAELRIPAPQGRYRYVRARWRVLARVIDAIGHLIMSPARVFPKRSSSKDPKSILLIQLDHLGDAVLSSALVQSLKYRYPSARIDVLASPKAASWFGMIREVNHVHVVEATRYDGGLRWIVAYLRLCVRLRQVRYELSIDVRGELPHAVMMWMMCIPRRIGWCAGGGGFLLTDSASFDPVRHELKSRAELLRLATGNDRNAMRRYWDTVNGPQRIRAEEWRRNERKKVRTLVFHVGAGTEAKRWPADRWVKLARTALGDGGSKVVLVGAADVAELGARIAAVVDDPQCESRCGLLDLDELVRVIEGADVFVGCDSGPAHVAAWVGTPIVVLFSGTNREEVWRPSGDEVRVVRHRTVCSPCHRTKCPLADHPCMTRITVEAAYAELRAVIRSEARIPTSESAKAYICSTEGDHAIDAVQEVSE